MSVIEAIYEKCFTSEDSLLSLLTNEQNDYVRHNHTSLHYKKNDVLYKDGDVPTGLFILAEGKVKIFREGVGHRDQIVRMIKPYGLMGYRALFANETHITSAVAIEESTVIVIKKGDLLKLIHENSKFALGIINSLAANLGFSELRTVTLTQKHIRGRLAESIIFLKDTYGYEKDNCTLNVYLSREDIANLSNMTTSNAIRTLSAFAEEGVISLSGKKIRIENAEKLNKISTMG